MDVQGREVPSKYLGYTALSRSDLLGQSIYSYKVPQKVK